jgi:hypothetical protein
MARALRITELPVVSQISNNDTVVGTVNGHVSNIPKTLLQGAPGPTGPVGDPGPTGPVGATGPAGVGFASITNILYADLRTAIDESSLVNGAYYKITDFKTCYDRPDYYVNKNHKHNVMYHETVVHPIVVLATSTNTISSTAYQPDFPNDRIQYDWTWNSTEHTESPAFGRITERIDEYNNRTDYDHRTIEFIRYLSYDKGDKLTGGIASYNHTSGVITGYSTQFLSEVSANDILFSDYDGLAFGLKVINVVDNLLLTTVVDQSFDGFDFSGDSFDFYKGVSTGNYDRYNESYIGQYLQEDWVTYKTFALDGTALNNYIGNYSNFYIQGGLDNSWFLLANNVFYSESSKIYSNHIGDRSYNNTAMYWFVRNTIAGRFYNNNIRHNGFYSNTIGEYCSDNEIRDSFYENKIGSGFNRNSINNTFAYNTLLNDFYNNLINGHFSYNNIGNEYWDNLIYATFDDNSIRDHFHGNSIYSRFYENSIGLNFYNNTIGKSSEIGNYDFNKNVIKNGFYNNTAYHNFSSNIIDDEYKANFSHDDFGYNKIGPNTGGNEFHGSFNANETNGIWSSNDFVGNALLNKFNAIVTFSRFGHGLIKNTFNTSVSRDFLINSGNIKTFTYSGAGGNTAVDGTYTNLQGTSIMGNGVDARFNLVVSGGVVTSVTSTNPYVNGKGFLENEGIRITGDHIGGKTGNITTFTSDGIGKAGANGVYTALVAQGTGDSQGENSTFNVTVTNGVVTAIALHEGGAGYKQDDVLVIPGSDFGGTNGYSNITITVSGIYSDDVIVVVSTINEPPPMYQDYNKEIFSNKLQVQRLSYYDEEDTLTIEPLLPTSFTLSSSDFTHFNYGGDNSVIPNGNNGFTLTGQSGPGNALYQASLSLNNGGSAVKLNEIKQIWNINELNYNNAYMFKVNWAPGSNPGSNVVIMEFFYDGDNNAYINMGVVNTSTDVWKTSDTGYANGPIYTVAGTYNFPAAFTLIEPIISNGSTWC